MTPSSYGAKCMDAFGCALYNVFDFSTLSSVLSFVSYNYGSVFYLSSSEIKGIAE
jgi:hypothetical protein